MYFVYIGRSHDAAAFHSSEFTQYLRNPAVYFPSEEFVIGDTAYPLRKHLMFPYPQSEAINKSNKREFNAMLSASRVSIERAFGLLVAMWRFLAFYIYIVDQVDINDIISACCILHNICIDRGEEQFELNWSSPFMTYPDDVDSADVITQRNTNADGEEDVMTL